MEWALHAVALNPPFGQSRIAMRTVIRQREQFPVHPEDGDICPFNYAAYRLVFDKVVQRTDEVPPQRHGRITHTGITRSVSPRAFSKIALLDLYRHPPSVRTDRKRKRLKS